MKRMLTILVALLVMVAMPLNCMAREEPPKIVPFYNHTQRLGATLSIDANGNASCTGELKGLDSDTTSSLTVTLYQYNSGWKKLISWSANGKGKAKVSASGTKKVTKGYKYKVVATGKIKDANGKVLESPTKSQEKSF